MEIENITSLLWILLLVIIFPVNFLKTIFIETQNKIFIIGDFYFLLNNFTNKIIKEVNNKKWYFYLNS